MISHDRGQINLNELFLRTKSERIITNSFYQRLKFNPKIRKIFTRELNFLTDIKKPY